MHRFNAIVFSTSWIKYQKEKNASKLQFITIIFCHKQYSNVLKVPKTSRVSSATGITIIISETKKRL